MSRISDHFTWSEATVTTQRDPATGLLVPNQPGPEDARRLALTFGQMERVRALLGRPVIIHSAFRSQAVNRAVGGAPESQHLRGEAVDFHVVGMDLVEAFDAIRRSDLPYDQVIQEAGTWVHISFGHDRDARREALAMRIEGGRARYYRVSERAVA